jgi:DNA-binding transcriptional regulator YdaS (Cro superfamily)
MSSAENKAVDPGLRLAIEAAGSVTALAKLIGMSQQALSEWRRVPAHRIRQIEAATGIAREQLRPDLYRTKS